MAFPKAAFRFYALIFGLVAEYSVDSFPAAETNLLN